MLISMGTALTSAPKGKLIKIDITGKITALKTYNGHFYFLDASGNSVHRFDEKMKPLNQIGRKGEGPGESTFLLGFFVVGDHIQLQSPSKISIFKIDGTFIKDINTTKATVIMKNGNALYLNVSPAGDHGKADILNQLTLYDKNLKKIADIEKHLLPMQPGYQFSAVTPNISIQYPGDGGRFYVAGPLKKEPVCIYDEDGNKIATITDKAGKPVKIDEEYKKRFLDDITSEPRFKNNPQMKAFIAKATYFAEYFPSFQGMFTDDKGNVYLKTYKRVNGKATVKKYNTKGEIIATYMLPDNGIKLSDANNYTSFSNTHYFYLYENSDGEYVLYSEKLE